VSSSNWYASFAGSARMPQPRQLQTRLRVGNGGPCVLASLRDTD
jgi:hypothetical protein